MKRLKELCEGVLTKAYLLIHSEKGQGLVEYGLIVVLIAVIVIFMLRGTGREVNALYSKINSGLSQ
jgi:pilus assembly protein Flp/PilA